LGSIFREHERSYALDTVACSVISVIETESSANFDVIGHDYYPLLNSVTPNYNFEVTFKKALREENANRNAFLLIAKDHLPNGKLGYRVELKLPEASPYDTITSIEELLIAQEVLDRVEAVAEGSEHSPYGNATAEIAGLRYFREIVRQINTGTFNLKIDLRRAGFTAEPITAAGLFSRRFTSPPPSPIDLGRVTAYDFVNLEETENNTLFRDLIGDGLKDTRFNIEGLSPITSTIIITDELSDDDDETAATAALANSDDKVVIWFHHTQDTLYTKKEFNFTAEEASLIIGHFYLEHLQQWQPELGLEEEEEPPALQKPEDAAETKSAEEECDLGFEQSCGLSWQWGKNCVLHEVNKAFDAQTPQEVESAALTRLRDLRRLQMGIVVGLFDGLLGTIQFVYDTAQKSVSWISSIASYLYETMKAYILGGALGVTLKITADLKEVVDKIVASYEAFKQLIEQLDWAVVSAILKKMGQGIEDWFGGFRDGCPKQGYDIGTIVFEVILGFFSGGSSVAGKITAKLAGKAFPKLLGYLQNMHVPGGDWINGLVAKSLKQVRAGTKYAREYRLALKCKILGKGCFIEGTPVLLASSANQFSLKNAGKAMVVAAAMPIVPVPIQEVQLLDYAVAHETVNSGQELLASMDNDVYSGLTRKDPYTSDQQRERDRYQINDTDWYEVVFEEVNGSSTARLALHDERMSEKGYSVDEVVSMNLPEQGISGPFRITSIKHILPQKRPTDEDPTDNFGFQPITGIFTHQSDDVWTLHFDNEDTLGVTYNHPIYSVTADDWRLAGELAVGETVMTLEGVAVLTSKSKLLEPRKVWNLEVREWHNFLVGESGILVHNSYGVLTRVGDFLEFKNPNGTLMKYVRQNEWSEADIITRRNNSEFPDEILELDAALKLKQSGVQIKALGMKANHSSGRTLGEIDILTNKGIVEVKTNVSDLKVRQMEKYMDPTHPSFINPSKAGDVSAKKILVYAKNGTAEEIATKKAEILEKLGDYAKIFDFEITSNLDDLANLMNN
jgi:hypothetical protein